MIIRLVDDQTVKTSAGAGQITEGDYCRFLGAYSEDPKWGRQFRADTWLPAVNGDRRGAIKYLASLCDGIGQARAKAIVAAYDTSAVRILREEPARVTTQGLLSGGVADAASAILKQHERTEAVTIALHGLLAGRGFGTRTIRACIASWDVRAAEIVGQNPWRLLLESIPGAGWKRVDRLYLERGGQPEALKRQAMAGWYALREADTGSTWHPFGLFSRGIVDVLGNDRARIDDARALAVRGRLVELSPPAIKDGLIADPRAASDERAIAYYLSRLIKAAPAAWPCLLTPAVSEHQADQVNGAATCPVMLLTGTPGTGKTFAAAALVRLWAASQGLKSIKVMAPTGKAAVRITEALAKAGIQIEATTIHRGLGVRKMGYDDGEAVFEHGPSAPLPHSLVVIDEASMLDVPLAAAVIGAVKPGAHLLWVGDPYQLPPIGHGAPLRDLIAAGIARAHLTEVKRNSGAITTACKEIVASKYPTLPPALDIDWGCNVRLVHAPTPIEQRDAVRQVLDGIRAKGGFDVIWDVALLTPKNDADLVGRKPLNDYLRPLLNPALSSDAASSQDDWRLRDKVICLKNSWERRQVFHAKLDICRVSSWAQAGDGGQESDFVRVANGELGRVVAVDEVKRDTILRFDAPTRYVRVKAPTRIEHDDGTDSAREEGWSLGYAMTGHKSQGSEWPYVIVILDAGGDRVASREWIYTAISRASRACLLIGTEETLRRQLRRVELPGRKTLLVELVKKEIVGGK